MPYPHILGRLITDARKAGDNTWYAANVAEVGPPYSTAGLSATGNYPATHWWTFHVLTAAHLKAILDKDYADGGLTPPNWLTMTGAEIRTELTTAGNVTALAAVGIRHLHFDANAPGDYGALATAGSVTPLTPFSPAQFTPSVWIEAGDVTIAHAKNTLVQLLDKTGLPYDLWYSLAGLANPVDSWAATGTLILAQSGASDRYGLRSTGVGQGLLGGTDKAMYTTANATITNSFTCLIAFTPKTIAGSGKIFGPFDSVNGNLRAWQIRRSTSSLIADISDNGADTAQRTIGGVGTIAANGPVVAGLRKNLSVFDTLLNLKITAQTAVAETVFNAAVPLTIGRDGINATLPDPGTGAEDMDVHAILYVRGALTNDEWLRIASDFMARAGVSGLAWTAGDTGASYVQHPDITMVDIHDPDAGPPTSADHTTLPANYDHASMRFSHHGAGPWRFSNGRMVLAHSMGMEDEDGAGQYIVVRFFDPTTRTWGTYIVAVPSQDVQSGNRNGGAITGVKILGTDAFVEVNGQVYLLTHLIDAGIAELAAIATPINSDGTVGTHFRYSEASYTPAANFSVIGTGSSDASLRAALRVQRDIYGRLQEGTGPNERCVIPTPNGDGQLMAYFKASPWQWSAMANATTGALISATSRASSVPSSPNRPHMCAIGDGSGRIDLTGTPVDDGGKVRRRLFNATTEPIASDGTGGHLVNVLQLRDGTDDLPTLSGLGSGYGRSGGCGYPNNIWDPNQDTLIYPFSRTGKQRFSVIEAPVCTPLFEMPRKDGGANLKTGRTLASRPLLIRSLAGSRYNRIYWPGAAYAYGTTGLPAGTAGLITGTCSPKSVAAGISGTISALASTGVGETDYLRVWHNESRLRITFRATTGDVNNTVEAMTTPLVAGTSYNFEIESTGSAYVMRINGVAQALSVISGVNNGKWFGDVAGTGKTFALGALYGPAGPSLFYTGFLDNVLTEDSAVAAALVPTVRTYFNPRGGVSPLPPFSPLDISGLALWLNAEAGLYQDDAATVVATADADPIAVWQDQSGNARHVTQTVASKRPTLKLAIQAGRQVIRCDGVDDFLAHNAYTRTQPRTIYLVVKQRSWTADAAILDARSTAQKLLVEQQGSAGNVRAYSGTASSPLNLGTTLFGVLCAVFDGASSRLRLNSGTAVTGNFGAGVGNGIVIGNIGGALLGTFPSAIDVAEVLDYEGAHSEANESTVREYLMNRWVIT